MILHPPLSDLHKALQAFVVILEEEISALGDMDLHRLAATVEGKNRLAESVAETWNRAMAWLMQQPGTERTAHGLHVPASILPQWLEILALARQADHLNRRNAQLVEAQLERTRGAIDVLQSASRPVNLYGADGQILDSPAQGHSLDKA